MAGLSGFFLVEDTLTPILASQSPREWTEDELLGFAGDVLDYARTNAPWSDRTGDARAGLDIDVFSDGTDVVMELYHTVDYGLYLETIESGEWAIIMPTIELFSSEIFATLGVVPEGEDLLS